MVAAKFSDYYNPQNNAHYLDIDKSISAVSIKPYVCWYNVKVPKRLLFERVRMEAS